MKAAFLATVVTVTAFALVIGIIVALVTLPPTVIGYIFLWGLPALAFGMFWYITFNVFQDRQAAKLREKDGYR